MHCAVPCQSTVPSFRFQGPCASFTACASHVRLRRNSWCPRAQFAAATPSLESPVQASPAHEREPRIYQDATAILGNTPMVRLQKTPVPCFAEIVCKLEYLNPCKSVKDRIATRMVLQAERQGLIQPGRTTLVEPTSGNTGVGLAWVAAARGYKLILTLPDTISMERRLLLRALGAELVMTSGRLGMGAAVREARRIVASRPDTHMLGQFENPANPQAHYETTGPEIWRDTEGKVDIFVAGVGTGGTLTGVGRYLKERNPRVEIIAVEPAESPVLSGGRPGYHQIEGLGAGFVPSVLDGSLMDEVIRVKATEAVAVARKLACEEGILCGISSGAAVHAAYRVAQRPENVGKRLVTVLPSFGERYISTVLYNQLWMEDAAEEDNLPVTWRLHDDLVDDHDPPKL